MHDVEKPHRSEYGHPGLAGEGLQDGPHELSSGVPEEHPPWAVLVTTVYTPHHAHCLSLAAP